jgi:hypothetical protein
MEEANSALTEFMAAQAGGGDDEAGGSDAACGGSSDGDGEADARRGLDKDKFANKQYARIKTITNTIQAKLNCGEESLAALWVRISEESLEFPAHAVRVVQNEHEGSTMRIIEVGQYWSEDEEWRLCTSLPQCFIMHAIGKLIATDGIFHNLPT